MTMQLITQCLPSTASYNQDLLVAVPQSQDHGRVSYFKVEDFTMLVNGQIVLKLAQAPEYVE